MWNLQKMETHAEASDLAGVDAAEARSSGGCRIEAPDVADADLLYAAARRGSAGPALEQSALGRPANRRGGQILRGGGEEHGTLRGRGALARVARPRPAEDRSGWDRHQDTVRPASRRRSVRDCASRRRAAARCGSRLLNGLRSRAV